MKRGKLFKKGHVKGSPTRRLTDFYPQLQPLNLDLPPPPEYQIHLDVYTDGSTSGNGFKNAIGGVGVFFADEDQRNVSDPFLKPPITSNRSELWAYWQAIHLVLASHPEESIWLRIFTDSKHGINCLTRWIPGWKANNWIKADGEPVKNRDIIEPLDQLIEESKPRLHVSFHKVKAHRTNPPTDDKTTELYRHWYGNFKADQLATQATRKQILKRKKTQKKKEIHCFRATKE